MTTDKMTVALPGFSEEDVQEIISAVMDHEDEKKASQDRETCLDDLASMIFDQFKSHCQTNDPPPVYGPPRPPKST